MHLSIRCILSAIAPIGASLSVAHHARSPTGNHIVSLKKEVNRSDILKLVKSSNNRISAEFDIISGFAGHFNDDTLNILLVNQTDAPWGLARVSSKRMLFSMPDTALSFTYMYHSSGGACSDIYIVDTGINTDHIDFGGRSRWGVTITGRTSDENGHGTHCA
ncbi:hypothetical protein BJ165DRAFT_1464594, partial [Panaeolus papilionaceus]